MASRVHSKCTENLFPLFSPSSHRHVVGLQSEHHHQVKGSCKKRELFLFAASTNCSLQPETASAHMTSQPFSAPPSIQFAAAQQSTPKITFIFKNWKMAQTAPKERMTTAWVQRGLMNCRSPPGTGNWNLMERDWMEPERKEVPGAAATDGQMPPKG